MTAFRVYTCTWNVAEEAPPDSWTQLLGLDQRQLPDLFALGVQEQHSGLTQMTDYLYEDPWNLSFTDTLTKHDYVRVSNVRTVGINLVVLIKRKWMRHVTGVETATTRLALGGIWGWKGGVTVSLTLGGINLCFVNCHLAAHHQYFTSRVEQFTSILEAQRFNKEDASSILSHDYVFWIGDLNFRIDRFSNEEIRRKCATMDLAPLLEQDQLKRAISEGLLPSVFHEGQITFAPTYKFDKGTDQYDTSKKQRKPGFCDRVLWSAHAESVDGMKLGVTQLHYTSHPEDTRSDHKPVSASFDVQLPASMPSLPVVFEAVRDWVHSENGVFTYTVNVNLQTSSWDWIGLYKMDYRSLDDYKTYIWGGLPGDLRTRGSDGSVRVTSSFHSSYVCEYAGEFCLAYHSYNRGCFVGISQPFTIGRSGESDSVDGDWSSSVDPD